MTERQAGGSTERMRGRKVDSCDETRAWKEMEGKTDRLTSLAIKPLWIHPGEHRLTWLQIRAGGIKQTSGMNRNNPDKKKDKANMLIEVECVCERRGRPGLHVSQSCQAGGSAVISAPLSKWRTRPQGPLQRPNTKKSTSTNSQPHRKMNMNTLLDYEMMIRTEHTWKAVKYLWYSNHFLSKSIRLKHTRTIWSPSFPSSCPCSCLWRIFFPCGCDFRSLASTPDIRYVIISYMIM